MFENLFDSFDYKEVSGLTDELKSIYIYNYYLKENKPILIVTDTVYNANKMYQILQNYTDQVSLFPMDDFLPMMSLASSPEFKTTRLETINSLIQNDKQIVITNLTGYLKYITSKDDYNDNTILIKKGEDISVDELINKIESMGYVIDTIVNKTGEIAIRGYVIDVFPIGTENPYRIELWGDTVESIKTFDINSQRTIKSVDSCLIKSYSEDLKRNKLSTIIDYMASPKLFYISYVNILKENHQLQKEINNYFNGSEQTVLSNLNEQNKKNDQNIIFINDFDTKVENKNKAINYRSFETIDIIKSSSDINSILNKFMLKKKLVICLPNENIIKRMEKYLNNNNVILTNEKKLFKNRINIIKKEINDGFVFEDYIVFSENDILKRRNRKTKYKTNFKIGTKLKDLNKLEIGDYVVHINYGIGRYCGIKTISKNGINKDYLLIAYKNDDKLYIPVEKIDLINKYSTKDGILPKLNKLGSTEWEKTKIKVKKKIENIAGELLELYAERQKVKGFAFAADDENQIEFEKEFPYEMTVDQIKASEDIKKEMQTPMPMDRLLCGDVGFGKTEVAFRAIFKAILSGKQAAFLCPTTILSSQHYNNAIDRFSSFPVNIAILNRFISKKRANEILKDLEEGKIDLLIGTHRILSNDVKFKNLGLLVVDEEQRFGVKHKEAIKKYRNNIDVLTLSATPIPRTLQMSMTGIRSLSLIETPPVNRLPVQTYVMAENDAIIKDAIYKELLRNGQCFILYNHIEDIEIKMNQISKLVPEARIVYAHGRMSQRELEDIMYKFINHEYDIMLCTTIIETGIDIPLVNTLIILEADHFGLSQLYQLRGRVGRSDRIAYCYLMYNPMKTLTDVAVKRLNVIKEFTALGSGFSIAMRDLSIRGAGDILGSEQAGFIETVGTQLFLKMLDDKVKELKGEKVVSALKEKNQPLLNVETSIKDNYVSNDELKIEIHQKINSIDSKVKLEEIKSEIEDRFGKVSEELIIYMYEEWFEKLANKYNINMVKQTKTFIEITLSKELLNEIDGSKMFMLANDITRMFRFKSFAKQTKLILDTVNLDKHYIYYLVEFFDKLDTCIK